MDSRLLVLILLLLIFVVVVLFSSIMLFRKAGYVGWEAIVPIYSTLCMLRMIGLPWWLVFASFIPYLNGIFAFCLMVLWLMRFNMKVPMMLGYLFLPIPFGIIAALSPKYDYLGPSYDYSH